MYLLFISCSLHQSAIYLVSILWSFQKNVASGRAVGANRNGEREKEAERERERRRQQERVELCAGELGRHWGVI